MDYKDQPEYSLKKNITPDIHEIMRISMTLAKKIIFYLPRNTSIDEFCDIFSEIYNEIDDNPKRHIFLDIQLLNSANKIKALLIIIGDTIGEKVYSFVN
jgi:hypothetical protein